MAVAGTADCAMRQKTLGPHSAGLLEMSDRETRTPITESGQSTGEWELARRQEFRIFAGPLGPTASSLTIRLDMRNGSLTMPLENGSGKEIYCSDFRTGESAVQVRRELPLVPLSCVVSISRRSGRLGRLWLRPSR